MFVIVVVIIVFMKMENLNKALPQNDLLVTLSSDEFQNMLSAWFEEKGIMSDLRSQVRFKMINVLKNTAIGRDITKKSSTTVSLSKQIINSIVAEHLMQNKYQYTMSIFNTEASVTNLFPNYSGVVNSSAVNEIGNGSFKDEDILNVLELVGISKGSRVCEEILRLYTGEMHKKSLLECLITWLNKAATWTRPDSTEGILKSVDLTNEPNLVKQIANFLIEYDFTLQGFKNIVENVKFLYASEVVNIEKQFHIEVDSLRKKICSQDHKIKNLHIEKKITENKLLKIYKDYNVLKSYTTKLLEEKENRDEAIDYKLQKCELTHCTDICEKNLKKIESLHTANYDLRKENCQQKEEINQLTRKYNDLLRSLSDCQSKINLLNSRVNDGNIKKFIAKEDLKVPELKCKSTFEVSDSSDSITEAILRETRLRLKTLEEESKEVEEKCFLYLEK